LAVGNNRFKDQGNRVVNTITHVIVKYSYGVYLGHTMCIWLAFWVLRNFSWVVQWIVFAALLCAIPFLVFVAVERPGIEWGKRLAGRWTKPSRQLVTAREGA
jgi:peptidoglycan/LPS O-acetylase OafA/YrhL